MTPEDKLPIPHKYWLQVYGGHAVDIMNPQAAQLDIVTIAHHLSQLCRFGGATREFYSVAQHCVHVSEQVPAKLARAALLHDAHEAFYGDTPGPVLQLLRYHGHATRSVLDHYRDLMDRQIEKAFCPWGYLTAPEIKRADLQLLGAEARDLLDPSPQPWPGLRGVDCSGIGQLVPWPSAVARARFLEVFDMTGGQDG